jgi:isopentenyl-diphosphate delta-isomerase
MEQGLFEQRKQDHMRIASDPRVEATGLTGFDTVRLIPDSLPNLDLSEIKTNTTMIKQSVSSPVFISSMTAGHVDGMLINSRLAKLSQDRNILMGVGSQRRELVDEKANIEWKVIRRESPGAKLISNIGIAQLIHTPLPNILRLIEATEAVGIFIHLNALQECLQPEGTPQFKGAFAALDALVKSSPVPVIVKEVGCGLSQGALNRFENLGVCAVDVSGLGGTHWGRIEGLRAAEGSLQNIAAETFRNWGLPTVQSLAIAKDTMKKSEIWASGGVRNGLDVAKCISMGASAVGVAKPFLMAALESETALHKTLDQYEFELKVAMFCTGNRDVTSLRTKRAWAWVEK